jgi:TusA-related sulfurtransferase
VQNLQLYVTVDGESEKQKDALEEIVKGENFLVRAELDLTINQIRLWAQEPNFESETYEADPERYAALLRKIMDTNFAPNIRAKFITDETFMQVRCRSVLIERGLDKWATATLVSAFIPLTTKKQVPTAVGAGGGGSGPAASTPANIHEAG